MDTVVRVVFVVVKKSSHLVSLPEHLTRVDGEGPVFKFSMSRRRPCIVSPILAVTLGYHQAEPKVCGLVDCPVKEPVPFFKKFWEAAM